MPEPRVTRPRLVLAFAAVYLIWGSTYLGIRFAIETIPPLLMAGTRFLAAGAILYGWCRLRGAGRPTPRQWRNAGLAGGLMLVGGNGGVTLAEQWVPSGVAALMVSTTPLWLVLLAWGTGGGRPAATEAAGIASGLCGVALLVLPGDEAAGALGRAAVDPLGAAILLIGSLAFAAGSLVARTAALPESKPLGAGMQMLVGGAVLTASGLAAGEGGRFDLSAISATSAVALLYLIVFGGLVAFSAYVWLLGATTPARAGTYAFVNPVVAVLLGSALAAEPLTVRSFAAMAVIVAGVVLITKRAGVPRRVRSESATGDAAEPEAATSAAAAYRCPGGR